jgi:hypothetical protein
MISWSRNNDQNFNLAFKNILLNNRKKRLKVFEV